MQYWLGGRYFLSLGPLFKVEGKILETSRNFLSKLIYPNFASQDNAWAITAEGIKMIMISITQPGSHLEA